MPVTPYAKLLAVVNGGSPQYGAITVTTGDVVQLSMESTVGVTQQRYEISDYPVGFTLPAGWSVDGTTGAYFYALGVVPPTFTIGVWGKYMLSLVSNNGANGSGQVDATLTDKSTALTMVSPNIGLRDMGFAEDRQFSTTKLWTGDHKLNLRAMDTALTGAVTALSSTNPASVGTVPVIGAGTTAARSDHVHGLPFTPVQTALAAATGAVAVNNQKITGLGAPSAGTSDAATATYAESVVTFARVQTALGAASSPLSFDGVRLTNVGPPVLNTDAATLLYVDQKRLFANVTIPYTDVVTAAIAAGGSPTTLTMQLGSASCPTPSFLGGGWYACGTAFAAPGAATIKFDLGAGGSLGGVFSAVSIMAPVSGSGIGSGYFNSVGGFYLSFTITVTGGPNLTQLTSGSIVVRVECFAPTPI